MITAARFQVVLGPCRCRSCGALVAWTGDAWHAVAERHGSLVVPVSTSPHRCHSGRKEKAA